MEFSSKAMGRRGVNTSRTLLRQFAATVLLISISAGCRSGPDLVVARQAFQHGALDQSEAVLQAIREEEPEHQLTIDLDLAMLNLARGDATHAEQLLRACRDRLDEDQAASISEATISYIADDNARAYKGSGYEQVMIRAMLALTNLIADGGDAEAYALQAQAKQSQLQIQATEAGLLGGSPPYQPLALAPYLRGMLRESRHQDYDDASRAYRLVSEIRPSFAPAASDLDRAENGTHSLPGNGVIYVFALVGRGPIRVPQTAEVTSNVLLAADRIVSHFGKYSVPPTMAPIEIPAVHVPATPVDTVHVLADNVPLGLTQSLTDIGQMAQAQFEAEKHELLVRAVARRIVKKSAVAAGKDALGIQDPTLQLVVDLLGSLWEATEETDTRCWSLLPREIQVLRAELPAGRHTIGLQSFGTGSPLHLDPVTSEVEIVDGRNTYVLAFAPHDRVIASVRN